MRVDDGKSACVLLDLYLVALRHILGNGIDHRHAAFVAVHVREGIAPYISDGRVVRCTIGNLLAAVRVFRIRTLFRHGIRGGQRIVSRFFAIRVHMYGHALRTHAVLVVVVRPDLGDGQGILSDLGIQRVGHVKALDFSRVALHRILSDSVRDLRAVLVDRQIRKTECPGSVLTLGDVGILNLLTVGQQVDVDLLRPGTAAVVLVHPCLGTGDLSGLRRIGIDHVITDDLRLVILYRILGYGVHDLGTVLITVHLVEGVRPHAVLVRTHHARRIPLAVGKQPDRDMLRTFSVAVIVVHPGLGSGNPDLFRFMGVGNGKVFDRRLVTVHRILGDGIDDLLLVLIKQWHAAEGVRPGILSGFRHGLAPDFLSVGKQVDGNGFRTLSVLIMRILPDLGHRQRGPYGLRLVGDHKRIRAGLYRRSKILFRRILLNDLVEDRIALLMHAKSREASAPAVPFAKCQSQSCVRKIVLRFGV